MCSDTQSSSNTYYIFVEIKFKSCECVPLSSIFKYVNGFKYAEKTPKYKLFIKLNELKRRFRFYNSLYFYDLNAITVHAYHSCLNLFYLFASKNVENIKYRSRFDDKSIGKVVAFSNRLSVSTSRMSIWFNEMVNACWYRCHVCNIRQASST